MALPACTVDQAPQNREKSGSAVDLVENDESVEEVGEIEFGLDQSRLIPRRLQIEVEGGQRLRDFECQGSLARLARSEQDHCRRFAESLL